MPEPYGVFTFSPGTIHGSANLLDSTMLVVRSQSIKLEAVTPPAPCTLLFAIGTDVHDRPLDSISFPFARKAYNTSFMALVPLKAPRVRVRLLGKSAVSMHSCWLFVTSSLTASISACISWTCCKKWRRNWLSTTRIRSSSPSALLSSSRVFWTVFR